MIFLAITGIVVAVLVYSYREFVAAYGKTILIALFVVTLLHFFAKEWLQAHELLLNHFYRMNRKAFVAILGVPPFVVFGHLFVVLMSWQLAVMYLQKLRLARHPVLVVSLIYYFTSAFSLLMENTGWVGGWWSWKLDSWWFFPELMGAPLIDLPWDRPMTRAWGYFVSTFWCVLFLTDLARKRSAARALALVAGLATSLALAPRPIAMQVWMVLMAVAPLASAGLRPSGDGDTRLFFPVETPLLQPRQARWNGAVFVGLLAMVAVCIGQIAVAHRWLALSSLFPIVSFALGAHRRWPVWVDALVALAVVLVGYRLNNGNILLAGWIVLRVNLLLCAMVVVARWREGKAALPAGVSP